MNVLIISTEKLPVPPVKGGAIQTYIAGVIPTLSRNNNITILGRSDPELPTTETLNGVEYVRVEGGFLDTYRENVIRYLQEHSSFDLVHIFNRPRLVTAVREHVPNARIILSMHNDMFKREKIEYEEGTKAVEQVDKIITISDYIGRTIVELYPEAERKVQTIYSGVNLAQFIPSYSNEAKPIRQAIRNEFNLQSKKVILFAGRLSPNKGVDVVIRALPEIAKNHPDAAFVIVGGKWFSDDSVTDYVAYVRAMAARSPIPVITTGFVEPTKIQEWFAAADIFVCPSQWQEPLARVHYEAMAAGLPIVTTNRGGNTEVIEPGKNGIIVENPEDPNEFAAHISSLLSNRTLSRTMGEYGRNIAEQKYNWHRVVTEIATVWDEVEHTQQETVEIVEQEQIASEELVAIPPISYDVEVDSEVLALQDTNVSEQQPFIQAEIEEAGQPKRRRRRRPQRKRYITPQTQILASFSGQRKFFTPSELKRQNRHAF